MMTGVNRLVLIGNVVSRPGEGCGDPPAPGECRFAVSVTRRVKNPDGTRGRETGRLLLAASGRAAAIAAGCRPGEAVYIEGRVRTRAAGGFNLREPLEVPEIVCEYVQTLGLRSAWRPGGEGQPGAGAREEGEPSGPEAPGRI